MLCVDRSLHFFFSFLFPFGLVIRHGGCAIVIIVDAFDVPPSLQLSTLFNLAPYFDRPCALFYKINLITTEYVGEYQ